MMLHILGLLFIGSPAFAQVPPVVANVVNNTDPRLTANGKPCRIKEAGSRQDTLHRDELLRISCISYDDGAFVELRLNGDTIRLKHGINSQTDSFYVFQHKANGYELPVVDGTPFQMYLIPKLGQ